MCNSLPKTVKCELRLVLLKLMKINRSDVAARPKPRRGILRARGGELWTAKLGTCAMDAVEDGMENPDKSG